MDQRVSFTERMHSSAAIVVMWCTVGSIIVGGAWAAFTLLSDVSDLKAQNVALSAEVEQLRTGGGAGAIGPQGPEGPAGPQGPQGLRGEPGTSANLDETQLRSLLAPLVADMVQAALSNMPQAQTEVIVQPGPFDFSNCLRLADFQAGPTAQVRSGMEFCGSDGRLLGSIEEYGGSGLSIRDAGGSGRVCNLRDTCRLPIPGSKEFFLERFAEDEQGPVWLARFNQ